MTLRRNLMLATAMLTLSSCTVFSSLSEVENLNGAQAVGSPFTQALTDGYRTFANDELYDNFDYPDALHFARKGLEAASGTTVLPEPVYDWNLNDQTVEELSAARGRLIIAFDMGARETAPELAAVTQVKFDCWIESQEENWSDKMDDGSCKQEFFSSLETLEGGLNPPAQMPVVESVGAFGIDASQPMEPENAMYLVFFNWDSAEIGSGALSVVDAVSGEVSKNPPDAINVVGHTDTSGPKTYNKRLAFKRANNVRDSLVQRGVDATTIAVDAKGEEELLVPTPDGVREPANRRVNISFE